VPLIASHGQLPLFVAAILAVCPLVDTVSVPWS